MPIEYSNETGVAICINCKWTGVPLKPDNGYVLCPVCESGKLDEPALKAGRNDPCPCESGKKFKKCCGR